jgi:hypothetical protein
MPKTPGNKSVAMENANANVNLGLRDHLASMRPFMARESPPQYNRDYSESPDNSPMRRTPLPQSQQYNEYLELQENSRMRRSPSPPPGPLPNFPSNAMLARQLAGSSRTPVNNVRRSPPRRVGNSWK